MKKPIIFGLLFVFALSVSFGAPGNLVPKWNLVADANAQTSFIISTSADNTRGFAFNPVTNHLLVVSRLTTPLTIWILNASDGSVVSNISIDTTFVTGGTFAMSKIGVADDGAIYVSNLAIANGNYRIYKYANETATPTLLVNETTSLRFGDSFRVVGSGSNTRIYVSGSSNSTVRIYNGEGTLVSTAVNPVNQFARQGIAPEGPGDGVNFWGTGVGLPLVQCNSAGATIGTVTTDVVPTGSGCAVYASFDGKKYVFTNNYHVSSTDCIGLVVDVTNGAENASLAYQSGTLKIAGYTPAVANGTMEVAYDPATRTVFYLAERNGISAWTVPAPVEDWAIYER
jgi:hypothetical protein